MTTTSVEISRDGLASWYRANRARTRELLGSIDPEAYYTAPIPLRHPFVFYDGHFPAFSFLVLHRRALRGGAIDQELETLFQRGIDPPDAAAATALTRSDWPDRDKVARFIEACDRTVLDDFARATLVDARNPLLVNGEAVFNILEHEEMHHETLTYLIHQLPLESKSGAPAEAADVMPANQHDTIAIPAGSATLGRMRDLTFGWDNEYDRHAVDVAAFEIDRHNVTNGYYMAFVRDGGDPPPFWHRADGAWRLKTVYDEIPLPLSWPVYVTHEGADAFATWAGGRLPTEEEYHRAAFGTPDGIERAYPWGDAQPDSALHGNFGFRRFDPEPIGSSPEGASAWGVEDLAGNGWEWTATPFGPFPGFKPMASYPQYSADFFDGKHYVMKGASPVTSRNLIRRSFRNWFFEDYPHMYATFRCAYD